MQQQIQDALAQLQTEVAAVRDTEQSAVALITGLQTQLANALNSSSDPTEVVAAVQAITDQLGQDAAPLAAAVANQGTGGGAGAPTGGTDAGSGSDTSGSSGTDTSGAGGTDTGTGTDTGSGDATDPTA
jgi:hypothetical protein